MLDNLKLFIAFLAALDIVGCAYGPEASQAERDNALAFTPLPGKARVYIIRPWSFVGAAVPIEISLDFKIPDKSCKPKSNHYYCVDTLNVLSDNSGLSLPE